jgi:hypothetical protein
MVSIMRIKSFIYREDVNYRRHIAHNANSDSPAVPPPNNPKETTRDPRVLLKVVKSLIRTRRGSVLTRNTILKMDHFAKGKVKKRGKK